MNFKYFSHSNSQTNKISINHKLMCSSETEGERAKRRLCQRHCRSSGGGHARTSRVRSPYTTAKVNGVSTIDDRRFLSLFVLSFGWFVIRLWNLENFIWVWEMRACRSVGFDMCPIEICLCVLEWVFNLICNFFSVCLDRKSWFLEKILNAQNIVF